MKTKIKGFRDALHWLDENYGYFLTPILNMGDPEEDYECSTAYVTLDTKAPAGFSFRVNPDYAETCSVEELAGVLAHETMHVLLNHLTLSENYPDSRKFNIAADLIINDYLSDAGFELPSGVLRGKETLGFDCALSDLNHVYHAIPDSPEGEDIKGESADSDGEADAADSDGEGAASGPCGFSERVAQEAAAAGKSVGELGGAAEAAARAAAGELLPSDLIDDTDQPKQGLGAGNSFHAATEMARETGTSLNWIKLLAEINPDILKKPGRLSEPTKVSYHAPRRKVAAYYPEIILPNARTLPKKKEQKGNRKPAIVLALDTSGSIPKTMVQKMTSLAASVPEDLIEVFCCTFSTQFVPYDHKSDRSRIAGGGTCFSAVENFIQKVALPQMKAKGISTPYPSAVVVITDGEANFGYAMPSDAQLRENWTWVLIPNSYQGVRSQLASWSGHERVKNLSELI